MKHILFCRRLILVLGIAWSFSLSAQAPVKPTSAEIYHDLQKLGVLGTALYVAAHPDDENTRLISYLANEEKVSTAYLSLTRGDGGQNLIGPEIRELLGVIRTQELLAARKIDGGEQFFSRANDFGYSKHPDETFNIWDRNEVLADVVWTIRKFQPDVIINRFSTEPGRTHGHHTASAILSAEAFEAAADPNRFPEQLQYVEVWQAKRLLFNTSWWFYGSEEAFEASDDIKEMLKVDVGAYNPLLGLSYTELAALSRSMHKCQAFGSTGTRGEKWEYLQHLKGDKSEGEIFEDIDLTWNRIKGGAEIETDLAQVINDFDWQNPGASVKGLIDLRKKIQTLEDAYWKNKKVKEIDEIILHCAGLYLEVKASDWSAPPGAPIALEIETINRSKNDVQLKSVEFIGMGDTVINASLEYNAKQEFKTAKQVPIAANYSQPYWLEKEGSLGMFRVDEQLMRGLPENPPALEVRFALSVEGESIEIMRPIIYKWTDDERGELYRPFAVTPEATINFPEDVYIFADEKAQKISLNVRAGIDALQGDLALNVPKDWKVEPLTIPVEIEKKGGEQSLEFSVTPPKRQESIALQAEFRMKGKVEKQALELIQYDHIPTQTVFPQAKAKAVKINVKTAGEKIAYLKGAGDILPESLAQIGYQVDVLDPGNFTLDILQNYDALVIGVRAYNKVERMPFIQPIILEYLENGGTVLGQYNTTYSLLSEDIGPYPFKISRDRVTVEEAEMRILAPTHSVLNFPNKIESSDFDDWVQERGLYFPNEWDENYTPIFSANDPGEDPKNGSLLVAKYGKGTYIYCTLSLFRELPAGVPGAYRLLANLVSQGNEQE